MDVAEDLDLSLSEDDEASKPTNNNQSTMKCAEITAAGKPLKITKNMMDVAEDLDLTEDEKGSKSTNNNQPKMRCAEVTAAGEPLKITCRPRPEVPDEGVLLKTLFGGVCHSDVHFIDDEQDLGQGKVFRHRDMLGVSLPHSGKSICQLATSVEDDFFLAIGYWEGDKFVGVVPGHEICGVVEEIGKQVSAHHSIKVGDQVIVFPFQGCRQCEACTQGQSNLCDNTKGGTTDLGQGVHSGGYGSSVAVPEIELCVKLPKVIKPEIGCMLPCSALASFGALNKAKPILEAAIRMRGVANLLVIGVGGLGMWAIIIVKYLFCDKNVKVICADTNKDKLNTAGQLGADDVIEWDVTKETNDLISSTTVNGYNMIDVAIDFVGSQKTVEIAFGSLHRGGSIIVVGLHGGSFPISLPELTSKSVSIQGMRTAGIGSLRQLVDLLAVQNLQTFPPIEMIKLDQINDVLDRLRKGEVKGRAIIKHGD